MMMLAKPRVEGGRSGGECAGGGSRGGRWSKDGSWDRNSAACTGLHHKSLTVKEVDAQDR
jgi:hypothetical protein